MFHQAQHGLEALGVEGRKPEAQPSEDDGPQGRTVKSNVDGVSFLFKKKRSTASRVPARFSARARSRSRTKTERSRSSRAKNVVIATGSDVAGIPGVEVAFDEKVIVSSTGALALEKVPASE